MGLAGVRPDEEKVIMQIVRAQVKSLCNWNNAKKRGTRTAVVGALGLLLAAGCGDGTGGDPSGPPSMGDPQPGAGGAGGASGAAGATLSALVGPEGGTLTGAPGTAMAGVSLKIPAGALAAPTQIAIVPTDPATLPLPKTAVECGPMFALQPAGLALGATAQLTLPFDEQTIADNFRFDDEVRVWFAPQGTWGQAMQTDSGTGSVTVEVTALGIAAAGVVPPKPEDLVTFKLAPNPKLLPCLAQYPDDAARAPAVQVTVVRGKLNDGLFLRGSYIKPGLDFDMFTVQQSSLRADGTVDPAFANFGLAWYQSDLEANERGVVRAQIQTILLDQIFGFDPAVSLAPTGTFHVGFWFNNPQDAVVCGFDATKPTPFNGEHQAGPLAMISLPDATTNLGPLCTKPDTSVSPARCSP